MKTLHLYLLRQVMASLLMTVLVFTFVLLLGNVLKEVLGLLVNGQASIGIVAEAVALLIPFVWVFALPMGMLTATLLVFGRFSADQELTAARAGGVSLISLSAPILMLSLVLCGLSAWVNMDLGPRSRTAYKGIFVRYARQQLSGAQLPEGRHIKEIPGYVFFIGKNRNGVLEDVIVYDLGKGTNPPSSLTASRGRVDENKTNRTMTLSLFDARGIILEGDRANMTSGDFTREFDLSALDRINERTSISDMSFMELRAQLRDLETRMKQPVTFTNSIVAGKRQQIAREQFKDMSSPIRVQMHRQLAFSFACFGFTLIGIPLGIRVQRRETNIGFAVAIVLVLLYYSFIMLGLSLDKRSELSPHLILWIPNFIFQVVGGVLLWRANKGI